MSVESILFSPVIRWRELCTEIVQWIEDHRTTDRNVYRLDRPRPTGALYLYDFLESYWEHGRKIFWRLDNETMFRYELKQFEFNGVVTPVKNDLPYPAYTDVGWGYHRSIEDANLVPNTYTSYFVFGDERLANQGLIFVSSQSP